MNDQRLIDRPSEADMSQCVHCGFCLQQCPTYLQLGMETDSPRGRIHLIQALAEERVGATPSLVRHLDLCLQCRACETACPSSVPFGRIMEAGRAMLVETGRVPPSWRARVWLLRRTLPYPRRVAALLTLLRLYRRSGLQSIARATLLRVFPHLREIDSMLPDPSGRAFRFAAHPPAAKATRRVAMLTGCVMPHLYPGTLEATVRVLERNGVDVAAPANQRCCGALSLHAGDRRTARDLAKRNIEAFLSSDIDAIVVNSAGCGSTMKEYGELLERDPGFATKARHFSSIVKDVSEFLVEIPLERPAGEVNTRVTYQDSCHLVHAQRVKSAPREILRSIPGLELVEMEAPDRCCGSAGIYSVAQRDMSMRLLDDKMRDASTTRANVIATANPGCMMQLEGGVRRSGQGTKVVHVVDLLDQAYRAGDP
jgi:glycolate oxidase iron-sulfur subunit